MEIKKKKITKSYKKSKVFLIKNKCHKTQIIKVII
jgi:hypothetical protein